MEKTAVDLNDPTLDVQNQLGPLGKPKKNKRTIGDAGAITGHRSKRNKKLKTDAEPTPSTGAGKAKVPLDLSATADVLKTADKGGQADSTLGGVREGFTEPRGRVTPSPGKDPSPDSFMGMSPQLPLPSQYLQAIHPKDLRHSSQVGREQFASSGN
jgi:hypothetical protein